MAEKILKSVILVESTTKARTLRKFTGRSYSIMSTDGFLKDLPKSRIGVDDNYQADYITVRGKGRLLAELKKETLKARRIFLATNPDAQGEFLARQYCEIFGVNPNSHSRIWPDELTRENFKAALAEARPIDENLADAFQTKQLIDKYVSHKVGDYLSCKIWRGVKVGRFRAMLLKLFAEPPAQKVLTVNKTLTPAMLQELALTELNFSTARTRIIAEQLYEGMNFDKDGYAGLITYPHGKEISLTAERREPAAIQSYLTEHQFKLYNLIYSYLTNENHNSSFLIPNSALPSDAALMNSLDALGVDWADFYSVGVASLLKRKYVAAEGSTYKITALGERVLNALDGFFDEVFSATAYNEVNAKIREVAAGKAQKLNVIENYCAMFNAAFDEAMATLGENAQPQSEPVVESDETCEKCGRKMVIRRGRYGAFLACSGYPECKNTKPLLEPLEQKCPKCGGRLAKRSLNRGRTFYCCESCDFVTWDEPQTITCKVCGATMFAHKFKDRVPMYYCGNESCSTRENHPMNKILADIKRRAEARKERKGTRNKEQGKSVE